jgi:hypothetical protein
MPRAVGRARIGTDLTAVVPGFPSGRLAAVLDSVATRETHSTAWVWRFSPDSVRGTLDEGRSAQDITAELAAVAEGELPQPLTYLITDTARRHGRLRVARAGCVIHGVEANLLAEIVSHRRLAQLGVRPLAPTVLLSRMPLEETLQALRAEGYAPVGEETDGALHTERSDQRRTSLTAPTALTALTATAPPVLPRPRDARAGARTPQAPDLARLAAHLLTAPDDPLDTGPS